MQNSISNLTILYVDDDELILENAVEYLNRICMKTLSANSASKALELYTRCKPDIIITDIKMPRQSGLEMIEQIRIDDKTTPIIITTAHTDNGYLIKAVELQLVTYLVKPITAQNLDMALQKAVEALQIDGHHIIQLSDKCYYNTLSKVLTRDNQQIKLTKTELLLIDLLAKNHHRTVSYSEIEGVVWGSANMSIDALRSLVRSIRKKLDQECIDNLSGVGYRLKIEQ